MKKLSLCILLLLIASLANATTYYVKNGGNDGLSGTSDANAWESVSKVNSFSFTPGDIVLFNRGDSFGTTTLRPNNSGSSGNLITFGTYGTGATPALGPLDLNNRDYIKVEYLRFYRNTSGTTIDLRESQHNTLDGIEMLVGTGNTNFFGGMCLDSGTISQPARRTAQYNVVKNSTITTLATGGQLDAINIRGNVWYNTFENNTITGGTHYVVTNDGDYERSGTMVAYNIWRGNTIDANGGAGMQFQEESDYNLVEGNTIYGALASGYNINIPRSLKMVGKYNIVRKNIIRDNDESGGTAFAGEVYSQGPAGGSSSPSSAIGNHVYNNVIYHNYDDHMVYASNSTGGIADEDIHKNNIIYDKTASSGLVIRIENQSDIQDLYWYNNIIWDESSSSIIRNKGTTGSVSTVQSADPSHWSGNIQSNPNLNSSFQPNSGSPAINAGAHLTYVTSPSGSGTSFVVADARYFWSGYGYSNGDTIQVGSATAVITNINYTSNTITVDHTISWSNGSYVDLPYNGSAPDIGVYETGSSADTTPPDVTNQSPSPGQTNWTVSNRTVSFTVTDSTAVDSSTLTFNINGAANQTCSSGLSCTPSGDPSSLSVTYTRGSDWSYSTTYTVNVAVDDTLGNHQATNWQFTTASSTDTTPPTVVNPSPASGETDWPITNHIVSLDVVDGSGVDDSNLQLNVHVAGTPNAYYYCGNGLACSFTVPPTNLHVEYDNGTDWAYSTQYNVTPSVYDIYGNFYAVTYSFYTENEPSLPPTIITTSLPDGEVGTAYSQTLNVTDGQSPFTWSIQAGSLPAGLSLGSSTGVISGTPTTEQTSNFTVQVQGGGTDTQALSITIASAPIPLNIVTTTLPNGSLGEPYSQTLNATGGTLPYTWSLASGSLPSGLSLSSAGVISGTPAEDGDFSFTVQVTDADTTTDTQALTLGIPHVAIPEPPGDIIYHEHRD